VAIKVDLCGDDTAEVTEEMVWFPRSQTKGGSVPNWLVDRR
jgi:hypothetical protein